MQSIFTYFFGSTPNDFNQSVDKTPFEPCPKSPNCTYHAITSDKKAVELFKNILSVLDQMSPFKMDIDQKSLRVDAIFRIALFGFKDDLNVNVTDRENGGSYLFIKSSSRVGHSDLGVNRRRIQKILSKINP